MQIPTTRLLRALGGIFCILLVGGFLAFSGGPTADKRAFVSAEKIKAAVETAMAEKNGPIGGIAVEKEEDGPTLIEVIVRGEGGTPHTIEVNAGTNEIEEVENGIEKHHRLEDDTDKTESEESSSGGSS